MKRWTIAVKFDAEHSDDGMDGYIKDDVQYLIPEDARKKRDEFFVTEDELDSSCTYASEEDAKRDFEWLMKAQDRWWETWSDKEFPEGMTDEMPDSSPEFMSPCCVEEVDV